MHHPVSQTYSDVAHAIAHAYAQSPLVEAVAWGGSLQNNVADADSDIDLYVYTSEDISLDERHAIAAARGEQIEVGNTFWESGDEWIERDSGIHIDVMFRSMRWTEDEIERVLTRHEASVGYSTCIWHNVRVSQALFDRNGAFGRLQQEARQPYPEALRQAVIAKNAPLLSSAHGAYLGQITKAATRNDIVSLNHRVAALLASYFDILFALNRQPHPGEKRLLELAQRNCPVRPQMMDEQIGLLLAAAGTDIKGVVTRATILVEGLEDLVRQEQRAWQSRPKGTRDQ